MAFCQKLTRRDRDAGVIGKDQEYRLPFDSEWDIYYGGASLSDAVYDRELSRGTANVGSKGANKYGLYDTRGNVWEWMQD